jgi:hypothetical protein
MTRAEALEIAKILRLRLSLRDAEAGLGSNIRLLLSGAADEIEAEAWRWDESGTTYLGRNARRPREEG